MAKIRGKTAKAGKNPLVTIAMPAYNSSATIKQTIDSILSQTMEDFELIIVDDCSVDNTLEIINSYKDARIILLCNKENLGLPACLNKAIKSAKGKYFARMDADDIMLPNRIEKQFEFMEKNNFGIISGKAILITPDGEECGFAGEKMNNHQIQVSLLFGCCLIHPTIFGKTSVFKKNLYNPEFRRACDYELWTRISDSTSFFTIPDILIKYRVGRKNIEQKKSRVAEEFIARINERNLIKMKELGLRTVLNKYGADGLLKYFQIKFVKLVKNSSGNCAGLMIYLLNEPKKSEGVGNVALNVAENISIKSNFLSLGKYRKFLFYSFLSPLYFALKARELNPAVVLVHTTEASFDPVVARFLFGFQYKIVCISHGLYSELAKEYLEEVKLRNTKFSLFFWLNMRISIFRSLAVKFCDAVTSVSSSVQKQLYDSHKVNSVVINNGVEKSFYYSKLSKKNFCDRIVFVGNQAWLKGLHYLVKANNLLAKPKKILAIGLDKPQQEELASIVDCSKVEFKQCLSRKHLLREYFKGGIFAVPSVYESFGMVYLEALCAGLPVVASKGTGAEDIISEGRNGFLAKKRDVQSIASAVAKAEKLCGKTAKPPERFLWKNIARQYEKIISGFI